MMSSCIAVAVTVGCKPGGSHLACRAASLVRVCVHAGGEEKQQRMGLIGFGWIDMIANSTGAPSPLRSPRPPFRTSLAGERARNKGEPFQYLPDLITMLISGTCRARNDDICLRHAAQWNNNNTYIHILYYEQKSHIESKTIKVVPIYNNIILHYLVCTRLPKTHSDIDGAYIQPEGVYILQCIQCVHNICNIIYVYTMIRLCTHCTTTRRLVDKCAPLLAVT